MSHHLVTEAMVRSMAPGSTLRVSAGTIVTPAAVDRAGLLGVRIERSAPTPPGALKDGDPVGLPDGDYLLEVRGGRARLRRIE